jgi:hypothetical protein
MVLNRGNSGAVLLAVTWVLLILTGILITLGYQVQLESLLYSRYKRELETKEAARNLLQLVIHRLQHDDSDYDAPGTIDFPYALAAELGYTYAAEVELWDEGSRFNLNNTPAYMWRSFFEDAPGYYTFVHQWFFSGDVSAYSTPAVVRQNYLFTVEELYRLPGAEAIATYENMLRPELTVFNPALFYLLDGETFLALLKQTGENYSASTEMAMIDAFNRNRWNAMYQASLFELVGRLGLPVFPDIAKLEPLVTTEGFLNPNFISPRHLNAVIGAPPANSVRLYELKTIQEATPFTRWEYFDAYLKEVYGENYPAYVRLYFTFKTRIWGVRIRIMGESGTNFCLTAVLERSKEKALTSWAIKILSLREEWVVTGEGGTGLGE